MRHTSAAQWPFSRANFRVYQTAEKERWSMDVRRRKLTFRAWRRGFREMDLLMGSFAEQHIQDMNDAALDEFERLLDQPDWEVYGWLMGQKPPPEDQTGPVLDQLMAFRYAA
jgi:antitoxin CptB